MINEINKALWIGILVTCFIIWLYFIGKMFDKWGLKHDR